MPDDLAIAVNRLRDSSAKLNKLTDKAASIVHRVEEFLNKECSAGIAASVAVGSDLKTDLETPNESFPRLEYRRHGGQFRICVVRRVPQAPLADAMSFSLLLTSDGCEEVTTPWFECERDTKLETIGALPQLLNAIAGEVDARVTKAERSVLAASDSLRSLTGKEG